MAKKSSYVNGLLICLSKNMFRTKSVENDRNCKNKKDIYLINEHPKISS